MTLVITKYGKIQGYSENGLEIFKGIPYAEAPIGELRFSPPMAKEPWNGIFDALEFGPCAYQGNTGDLIEEIEVPTDGEIYHVQTKKLEPESEDCLSLNIWTPATDSGKRPVMFWIHGGAFKTGSAKMDDHNGSALAQYGDVVIVTINYRLGALGYLYIPCVTANVGQLDQILALKWVHDNIHLFGGDPDNVTIFGGSAGGYSVITLCAMPAAKGLFQHVISQSPPLVDPIPDESPTKNLMNKLGIKEGDIHALREIPVKEIIKVQDEISKGLDTGFRPQIDGETLPIHPLKAFQTGKCKNIDLMMGTTLDELTTFIAPDPSLSKINDEQSLIGILTQIGIKKKKIKNIIMTYKKAREGKHSNEPKQLLIALLTDMIFRIPTLRLLEDQSRYQPNTYSYLFTWASPAFNGALGSFHGLEMVFVFRKIDDPELIPLIGLKPNYNLSSKIKAAWTSFAHNGNPNTDQLPQWPTYEINNRATMIFGKKIEVLNAPLDQERAVWDEITDFLKKFSKVQMQNQ
jgi:para-nitrobenzyl esterase